MSLHILILAGGSGQRLWPISSQENPKQLINGLLGKSLLEKTIERVRESIDAQVTIITNENCVKEIEKKCIGYTGINVIAEPVQKNTLGAVVYALNSLELIKNDYVIVMPCDHFFSDPSEFFSQLLKYLKQPQENHILTFGIKPYKLETGYGYIEAANQVNPHLLEVEQFIEKPNSEEALKLIQKDDVYWNCGIFGFTIGYFYQLLQWHAVKHAAFLDGQIDFVDLPNISIDKGIMENISSILLIPLYQKWLDVGSWDRLHELFEKDANENVLIGEKIKTRNTTNCLVLSKDKHITTLGLDDLFIIESDDHIVIGKRCYAESVKEVAKEYEVNLDSHAITDRNK